MVTKMAKKIGLKERNCHFEPNLRLFQIDFLRIRYKHKRVQKKLYYIVCRDNSHPLLKYLFGICLCSMLISLSTVLNLLENGHFPIFRLIWQPFLLP